MNLLLALLVLLGPGSVHATVVDTDFTGPAVPASGCVDSGLMATYNSVNYPLMRCFLAQPQPGVCDVLMPNWTSPLLFTKGLSTFNTLNMLRCDTETVEVTMGSTTEGEDPDIDPWAFCHQACLSATMANITVCRSFRINHFADDGVTASCTLTNCKGSQAYEQNTSSTLQFWSVNADSSYRSVWYDDMPSCADAMLTYIPPTLMPTASPTTLAPTIKGYTYKPTHKPTSSPTYIPTRRPTEVGETWRPTQFPTAFPTSAPVDTSLEETSIIIGSVLLGISLLIIGIATYFHRKSYTPKIEKKKKRKNIHPDF